MDIGYDDEQLALRQELRAYYDKLLTPEVREALHKGFGTGPDMRRIVKQMAADGWLGIGWPVEYGGRGADLLRDPGVLLGRRLADLRGLRHDRSHRPDPLQPRIGRSTSASRGR